MESLVQMVKLTRQEFDRGLEGVSDEDVRRRVGSMNCISWIVGHVAHQQHAFFRAWPRLAETDSSYRSFGYDAPPSEPPLDEVMSLWRTSCIDADTWLDAADARSLLERFNPVEPEENGGTLIVRFLFPTWSHIGEINAIRQMLGHRAPEFVDMHGWVYDE